MGFLALQQRQSASGLDGARIQAVLYSGKPKLLGISKRGEDPALSSAVTV